MIIDEKTKKKSPKKKGGKKKIKPSPLKKQSSKEEKNPYDIKEIYIDPNEEIIGEGELLRFKPGFEKNFIHRWLQLSSRSLRYYKNHYHSICYLTRPIAALPLYAIEEVNNFTIDNENYKKRDSHLYSFMFEVVLRQDYEDIFEFRELEVNGVPLNN